MLERHEVLHACEHILDRPACIRIIDVLRERDAVLLQHVLDHLHT